MAGIVPRYMEARSSLAKAKEIVLLVTAIGLPLVFFGRHEDEPFNITKLSLLLAGVSCASGLHIAQLGLGHRTRGLRRTAPLAIALTMPLAVSWLASPYRGWALFGQYSRFNGLLPYAAFALLGVLLVDAFWGRPLPLAKGLAGAGGIVGAYALAQSLGLDPLWQPGTDAGTPFPPSSIGHYNFAGGFLAISLPFSIYLWARSEPAWPWRISTIATTVGLVMTNSQGGWVAAVAGALVVGGALAAERWRAATTVSRTAVASLSALIVVGVVVSAGVSSPALGGTAKARGLLWRTAVQMGADSPVVGRGPAAYAVEGVRHRTLDYILLEKNTKADDPHSVPLSFWANAGVLGAVGFLLFALFIAKMGVRLDPDNAVGGAFFAGSIAYLVQALVSIDEPSLRAGLWIALAGLVICSSADSEVPPQRALEWRPRVLIATVSAVAVAGVGLAYSFGLMRAHRDVVVAKELFDKGKVSSGQLAFSRATRFRFEPHYLNAYAFELGLAGLDAEHQGGPLVDRMTEVNTYLDHFPETNAMLTSAKIYLYRSHFDSSALRQAEELLLRLEPLDPADPEVEMTLAEVYLAGGDTSAARALLEPLAQKLSGDLGPYWGTLAVARAMDGDTREGEAALQQAVALDSSDCRVLIARGLYEQLQTRKISELTSSSIGFNCPAGDALYLQDLVESLST